MVACSRRAVRPGITASSISNGGCKADRGASVRLVAVTVLGLAAALLTRCRPPVVHRPWNIALVRGKPYRATGS